MQFSWHTVREYLDTLDSRRTATNPVYLVPQGNLRLLVVGPDNRPATPDEISKMEALLALALEEGAVGMSSGLTYVPGMYAPTSELAALCRVVKRYWSYYCPHTRSYGKGALEAYAEMIELARQTGVALHLTHATMNFAENRGRASELLDLIDDALEEGLDVSLDTYPYLPGSTTLAALLPSWAASGGPDATLARLADQDQLSRIREGVEISGSDGCHGVTIEWATVEISGTSNASLSKYIGRTLEAIAQEEGRDPFDVFCDILVKDGLATTILQHVGDESNVRTIMRHHTHCGGSDGILTSTKPHPRAWGTFPRYLGHYARDLPLGLAPPAPGQTSVDKETVFAGGLEECVHHLTGRPAARLRLRDRGLLREGYRADLVLFDPERVEDAATFANPRQAARGVRAVLVNGVFALDETRMTGAREGKTLRLTKVKEEWIVQ